MNRSAMTFAVWNGFYVRFCSCHSFLFPFEIAVFATSVTRTRTVPTYAYTRSFGLLGNNNDSDPYFNSLNTHFDVITVIANVVPTMGYGCTVRVPKHHAVRARNIFTNAQLKTAQWFVY